MALRYLKQLWADLDPSKPPSAARFLHMEQGIVDAHVLVKAGAIADADIAAAGQTVSDGALGVDTASGSFVYRSGGAIKSLNGGSLPVFGIARYGAATDNVTDDWVAINAALQAAKAAGGGVVYIPKGVTRFGQTILVPDGVLLMGAGQVIVGSNVKGSVLRPKGINAAVAIQPEHIDATQESMQLSDFCLDLSNNGSGLGTLSDCGIDVRGVFNDSFLRDIVVYGNANMGVPGIRYAPATQTDGCGAVYNENVHVVPGGHQTGIKVVDTVVGGEANGTQSCVWVNCTVEGSGNADAWLFQSSFAASRVLHHTLIGCRGRIQPTGGSGIPLHIKGCQGIVAINFYGQVGTGTDIVKIESDGVNAPAAHVMVNIVNAGGATVGVRDVQSGFVAATPNVTFYAMGGIDAAIHPWYVPASGAIKNLSTRSVVLSNAALATAAISGFTYLPSCAGTPTGTPSSSAGAVPIVIDTTGTKLWAFIGGAWKSVSLA